MLVILFDLDGTLIDSTEAIYESFEHALKVGGMVEVPRERIHALIGYPLDEMFFRIGVGEARKWEFVEYYKKHYRPIAIEKTTLLKDAKEAVEFASKYATLGVVTTKTSESSKAILENLGVLKYFQILIGREDVAHPKPHPEPILKAVEFLQADREKTWMIGDTKLDVISSKEAKIHCVGVSCGHNTKEELSSYGVHIEPSALGAVKRILKLECIDTKH